MRREAAISQGCFQGIVRSFAVVWRDQCRHECHNKSNCNYKSQWACLSVGGVEGS